MVIAAISALLLFGVHVWSYILAGAFVVFLGYTLWNPPKAYRRHGWDQARQSVNASFGISSGPYFWQSDGRRRGVKVGRNELCPCGSGRKYKRCCGRAAAS
jgi:hypothetical protein